MKKSQRIAELRGQHAADTDALAVIGQLAHESEMHLCHSDCPVRVLRRAPANLTF